MSSERKRPQGRTGLRSATVALLALTGLLTATVPVQAYAADPAATGRAATARAAAGTIPDKAFLQPEDLGGAGGMPADADLRPYLRPPQPCAGPGGYRALGSRRASGAVSILFGVGEQPTVLVEDLGVYRGDGARRYLRQLRWALSGDGCVDGTREWTVLESGFAGRNSLLIELGERVRDYDGNLVTKYTYLFVAQVGSAVVVLADIGWELGNGHRAVVRDLAPAAVRRAATLG